MEIVDELNTIVNKLEYINSGIDILSDYEIEILNLTIVELSRLNNRNGDE